MKKKKYRVYGIGWDANDIEKMDLPKEIEVELTEGEEVENLNDDEEVEDYLSDYITDETGFCHFGFSYEEI